MANEEHLKRLREAIAARNIAAWNKWREENRIIPFLGRADLRGANLENANLKRADLWGANLREANLRGADFHEASLQDADLTGAKGLSQWQIKTAKTNKGTKLPPDLQRPKHWEEDLT